MEETEKNIKFYLQMAEEGTTDYERYKGAKTLHEKYVNDIDIDSVYFDSIIKMVEEEWDGLDPGWEHRHQRFHHLFLIISVKISNALYPVRGEPIQIDEILSRSISIAEGLIQKTEIDWRHRERTYIVLRESKRDETVEIIITLFDHKYNDTYLSLISVTMFEGL